MNGISEHKKKIRKYIYEYIHKKMKNKKSLPHLGLKVSSLKTQIR